MPFVGGFPYHPEDLFPDGDTFDGNPVIEGFPGKGVFAGRVRCFWKKQDEKKHPALDPQYRQAHYGFWQKPAPVFHPTSTTFPPAAFQRRLKTALPNPVREGAAA